MRQRDRQQRDQTAARHFSRRTRPLCGGRWRCHPNNKCGIVDTSFIDQHQMHELVISHISQDLVAGIPWYEGLGQKPEQGG